MASWGAKVSENGLKDLLQDLKRIDNEVVAPAIDELAKFVRDQLIAYIDQGRSEWPPLSEVTKWIRGGSDKVMSSSEDFKRAIEIEIGDKYAKVGILIPKGSKGQDLETIAKVMEGGAYIPVTDKMRAFFAAKGKPLKPSTTILMVPERPVFNPAIKELDEKVDEIFGKYFDELGGNE
jgi:hypothetical protein